MPARAGVEPHYNPNSCCGVVPFFAVLPDARKSFLKKGNVLWKNLGTGEYLPGDHAVWVCFKKDRSLSAGGRQSFFLHHYLCYPSGYCGQQFQRSAGGLLVPGGLWTEVCGGCCHGGMPFAASCRKKPEMHALYTINCPGYNLGNITIPFLQGFYPSRIPYLCMFETADSCFRLGATYAIACTQLGKKAER